MNVVSHQNIGMNAAAGLASILGHPLQIEVVILFSKETSLAVIPTLDQVQRNTRQDQAGAAWHGSLQERIGYQSSRKPWSVPVFSCFLSVRWSGSSTAGIPLDAQPSLPAPELILVDVYIERSELAQIIDRQRLYVLWPLHQTWPTPYLLLAK
jgi:hypothetical protein